MWVLRLSQCSYTTHGNSPDLKSKQNNKQQSGDSRCRRNRDANVASTILYWSDTKNSPHLVSKRINKHISGDICWWTQWEHNRCVYQKFRGRNENVVDATVKFPRFDVICMVWAQIWEWISWTQRTGFDLICTVWSQIWGILLTSFGD